MCICGDVFGEIVVIDVQVYKVGIFKKYGWNVIGKMIIFNVE